MADYIRVQTSIVARGDQEANAIVDRLSALGYEILAARAVAPAGAPAAAPAAGASTPSAGAPRTALGLAQGVLPAIALLWARAQRGPILL
jgi:hypothetical protein